ncbi:hypothetical protein BV898_06285 [Hypsibius exemplaris]|uniref:Thyroglobulin type-1 domain-containing protein n=1 Tax=Hypsibius exemplaris TaxID=2072580 RepID=A0A1W0WX51_HYPEX|nr:hypothetical protein BV898_06285 [Hypsibius exemplaris]
MDSAQTSFLVVGMLLLINPPTLAQGPPLPTGTCNAYAKLAASSTVTSGISTGQSFAVSGNPAMNKPGLVPINGANGETMVLPGKSTWVPQCQSDGTYATLQKRVNGNGFCVNPANGELTYDLKKPASGLFWCGCFAESYRVMKERERGTINPMCDEKTGLYQPLQIISNQSPGNICVKEDGTRNSEPFMGGAGTCKAGGIFVATKKNGRK